MIFADHVRDFGPIKPGFYRLIILEINLCYSFTDYADLESARKHANDVVAEIDDNGDYAIAEVYDENFDLVHKGRPYYSK